MNGFINTFHFRRFLFIVFALSFLVPNSSFSQEIRGGNTRKEKGITPGELKYKTIADKQRAMGHDINKELLAFVGKKNTPDTWKSVRSTITNYLREKWRAGILLGSKPEEAFFVKADQTTMTQNDIDMDKLIVMVGLAFSKPAEFVIIRIEKQL